MSQKLWGSRFTRVRSRGGKASILEAITSWPIRGEFEIVVDTDKLRVIQKSESIPFWKNWWKNHKK